jgi:iron-sulfur cluster assembly accessory protein
VQKVGAPSSNNESRLELREVVKLTPSAVAHLRTARRNDGRPYLRVAVVGGGSTWFKYDMNFDDQVNLSNDYLNDFDGIKTIVDKRSAIYLEGATIDWQSTPNGRQGFKFDNPNAVKEPPSTK